MVALARAPEQALAIALEVGVPIILWGDPGIGKTSVVNQIALTLGLPVETVIAALREPQDFGGMPMLCRKQPAVDPQVVARYISARWGFTAEEVLANYEFFLSMIGPASTQDGVVRFAAPQWAVRLAELGQGLLFLDEISTARPAVQTSLLRVVLERVVGELALPAGVRIVAAANKPDQIAGGWDLTSPLANRFCHMDWDVDSSDWCDGFLYGWPSPDLKRVPANWKERIHDAKSRVTAFIRHRPELLKQVPSDEAVAGRAWPSPRSWDMATRLYAACLSMDAAKDIAIMLVRGCVGDGPAFEYFQYLEDLSLPDPEELLENPGSQLPDRDDLLYAALGSVVFAVRSKNSPERWSKAWKVLNRAATSRSVDVAVAHAYALAESRPKDSKVPPEVGPFVNLLRKAQIL